MTLEDVRKGTEWAKLDDALEDRFLCKLKEAGDSPSESLVFQQLLLRIGDRLKSIDHTLYHLLLILLYPSDDKKKEEIAKMFERYLANPYHAGEFE